MQNTDTLIVGGGQAGLATSYHLKQAGRDHLVVEAGRIGETWRTKRWDSFTLVTPTWTVQLPGLPSEQLPGGPKGFLERDQIVATLEGYAASFGAPVREHVRVETLEAADGQGYVATTSEGPIAARRVVVTSGWFARPRIPRFAADISPDIRQLDSTTYRKPADLPPGGVLVVGSGQSGVQIVEDLQLDGREVWLSVGRAGRFPRRYRGRDLFEWGLELGLLKMTEDKVPDPRGRFGPNPHITGARGGHTINLHRFARDGVHLVGRVSGADGARLRIDPDLHERLAGADKAATEIKGGIDKYIAEAGVEAPEADSTNSDDHDGLEGFDVPIAEELDLEAAGIRSIIWAGGLVPDFSWIRVPIFDASGTPKHEGGITPRPGLAFVGLRFQRWLKSDLFIGVGEDAEHVVEQITAAN